MTTIEELFSNLATTYCYNETAVNGWLSSNCKDVVGFSFELARQQTAQDVPTPPEDIAYVQVVSGSSCMIARVCWGGSAPEKLKDLLTDVDVIKVLCGVNAVGLRSLTKIGLELANYIDLAEIDRKTSKSAPKKDLATLSNENFEIDLGVRPSDAWTADLTDRQKLWLAVCPLLCLKIFENNVDRATSIVRRMALPCEMCDRVFSSTKSLDLHHQAHEENAARPQHICPVCQKHFRSPPALVQHMDVAHPAHPLPRPDTQDGNTHQYYCGECDAHYPTVALLSKHQSQTGHQSQTWVCSCCNKRFGTRSALDMHYHVTHGSATTEKTVHLCGVCQRCFSSCDALYQHQLCVGHSMTEICLVCAASFRDRQELDAHFGETKHGDYWLCSECPKKFLERDALAKHEASTGHKDGFKVMDVPPEMAFKFRMPRRQRQRREEEAEIPPFRTADVPRRPWNNIQPVLTRTPVPDSIRYPLYTTTAEPYIGEPKMYHHPPMQYNTPVFSPTTITVPIFEGPSQPQPQLYYRPSYGEFLVPEPTHMSGLSSPLMAPLVPCQSQSGISNISPTNSSSGSESVGYSDHGVSPSAMTSTPPKPGPYRQDGPLQAPSPYSFYQPSTPPPAAQQFVLHSHSRGPSTPEQGVNYIQFWTEATAPHMDTPSPGPRFWVLSPTTLFRCHQSVPPSPQYDLIKAMGRGTPAPLKFDDAMSHNPYPQ